MNKRFYLTTAIDYANGQPHLGHAYEKVVTDVIARTQTALGEHPFFLTGLDEHGQKVQHAAQAGGQSPQTYCDDLAAVWSRFVQQLGLSNQDFIRTTSPRHQRVVQAILTQLHQAGQFYRSTYTGWYSAKEETFLTEKDRRPDGTFDPQYGDVHQLSEDNYYFRLKDHQDWLIAHIESNPSFIQPDFRRNEVLGFLRSQPLEDLCISRPTSRLGWGIPIPFDPAYVTYVWFDALVNYISVPASLGDPVVCKALNLPFNPEQPGPSLWPANVHVIGKDILKFHAVYWPIMLKAMNLPLPHQILAHGWWQKDGQKMSKSTGNIVDPILVIASHGLDAFRYYVVRELDIGPDGNWTDAGFEARYSAELANGIGNLVNRSLSMLRRYRQGTVPAIAADLQPETDRLVQEYLQAVKGYQLQRALIAINQLVTRANQFVDQTAPFKLAKDPSQSQRLDEVLYNLAEVCRILSILLHPFLPTTANRIQTQLGLAPAPVLPLSSTAWGGLKPGHATSEPAALFPRLDPPKPAA